MNLWVWESKGIYSKKENEKKEIYEEKLGLGEYMKFGEVELK